MVHQNYTHYAKYFKPNVIRAHTRNMLYHKLVPRGITNVLEFGIGNGYFGQYCEKMGINYTGVNYSTNLLQHNKCKQLIAASIPDEFYKIHGIYDLIMVEHFIEHLHNYNDVFGFLSKCRNQQKTGGKILLLYPNYDYIGKVFFHDPTHEYITTRLRVEKCLIEAGYKIDRSGDYSIFLTGIQTLPMRLLSMLPMPISLKLNVLVHSFTVGGI